MEILFVSHKFPPATGGMEMQSYQLITGMHRYAKVHYLVYEGKGSLAVFFLQLQKTIVQLCRKHPGICAIHYNDGLMAAFSLLHRKYPHLKRFATLHGLDVVFPLGIYQRHILPRLNCFDRLIAVSQVTAEKAISAGIRKEKLKVIANGVNHCDVPSAIQQAQTLAWLKELGICPQQQAVLVMMGRAVKRKGFSWFLKQVLPLLEGDFRLLIIGPFQNRSSWTTALLRILPTRLRTNIHLFLGFPSDERAVREWLNQSPLAHKVKHMGRLPLEKVQSILALSTGFLMPNISIPGDMEGFGLVTLEASLMGIPVFAADLDGIPEAIKHGKNGFLLPSAKPQAWAGSLNHLIKNPAIYKSFATDFRQHSITHYGWDKMVKAYYDLFNKHFCRD